MQKPQSFVRIMLVLTKILTTLLLISMILGIVSVVATLIAPSPILLRTPSQQLTIRTTGLDLVFKFDQEKHPSHAITISMLAALAIAACNIMILFQLHKILSTVLEGSPFVAENARRLHYIAFALIAITCLGTITGALTGMWQQEMIQ